MLNTTPEHKGHGLAAAICFLAGVALLVQSPFLPAGIGLPARVAPAVIALTFALLFWGLLSVQNILQLIAMIKGQTYVPQQDNVQQLDAVQEEAHDMARKNPSGVNGLSSPSRSNDGSSLGVSLPLSSSTSCQSPKSSGELSSETNPPSGANSSRTEVSANR